MYVILIINFSRLWNFFSQKCDESTVWVRIFCRASSCILLSQRAWTSGFFYKKWSPNAFETGRFQLDLNRLKYGIFPLTIDIRHFYTIFPAFSRYFANRFWNFQFVDGLNLDLIDSLKSNGRNILLIFGDSYERVCKSKASFDNGTAKRHRGLTNIYKAHTVLSK